MTSPLSPGHHTSINTSPRGQATMSPAMARMEAYPAYLLRQVNTALGNRVWEIGVGNGQAARSLLQQGRSVLGTDIDDECLNDLRERMLAEPSDEGTRLSLAHCDLEDPGTMAPLRSFLADSVVCFNVLEHISDDQRALRAIRETVAPDAKLGIIVPAHHRLFGRMDREAGHYRRYSRSTLREALMGSGWNVQSCRYINALGAAGWWYHNRWRRTAGLGDEQVNHQMLAADRWLPQVASWTDPWFGRWFGLSVVAIATTSTIAHQTSRSNKPILTAS